MTNDPDAVATTLGAGKMQILDIVRRAASVDPRVVFCYVHGSFLTSGDFRDIDIAVHAIDDLENAWVLAADLKAEISRQSRIEGHGVVADLFDVQIANDAPFTFLSRVFEEGLLLVDRDPEARTDVVERVSYKYRECAGLLAEAALR